MRKLPPNPMSNYNRLFREMRLHPWVEDHKRFIDAELARLSVAEPDVYERFKEKYAQKEEAYVPELEPEPVPTMADLEDIINQRNLPLKGNEDADKLKEEMDINTGGEPIPTMEDLEAIVAAKEAKKMTVDEFKALPADKQKELVKDLVTEENNGSNTEKRLALYFPSTDV